MAIRADRLLAALVVAAALGALCVVQSVPARGRDRPSEAVERNNFTVGDCSLAGSEVLLRDRVYRPCIHGCHVSTVLLYDGRGYQEICNVTCVRAENFLDGTTGGNFTFSKGAIGESMIQLTFMSEFQKGYDYHVEIWGEC